jgi:hypothetical protein
MKKILLFLLSACMIWIAACNKTTTLPPYTPPVTSNFSVTSLKHTQDSVNVGDTIWYNAAGTVYDTTQSISAYFATSYTVSGTGAAYNYGTSSAPVTIKRTIVDSNNGVYDWTATIAFPTTVTQVPHKTKLTTSGTFMYQLTLSSQQGALTASDSGPNKSVYVR